MKRSDLFILFGLAITLAVYVLSNEASRWLIERTFHTACGVRYLALTCAYAPQAALDPTAYGLLAAALIVVMAFASVFLRENAAFSFVLLMGFIGLGAVIYDMLFHRPVLAGAKIVNDTENILSFAIMASFALIILILRNGGLSLRALTAACIISYAVKIAMMLALLSASRGLIGAAALYLLYIVYAFGTFSLHIMTVSAAIGATKTDQSRQGGPAHAH